MSIKITLPNFASDYIEKDRRLTIPKITQGLYFLYGSNKELLYVGKAKRLRERVSSHINGTAENTRLFSHLFEFIRYINVNCPYEREIYETFAINTYFPKFNSNKTYTYTSEYLEFVRSAPKRPSEIEREQEAAKNLQSFNIFAEVA